MRTGASGRRLLWGPRVQSRNREKRSKSERLDAAYLPAAAARVLAESVSRRGRRGPAQLVPDQGLGPGQLPVLSEVQVLALSARAPLFPARLGADHGGVQVRVLRKVSRRPARQRTAAVLGVPREGRVREGRLHRGRHHELAHGAGDDRVRLRLLLRPHRQRVLARRGPEHRVLAGVLEREFARDFPVEEPQ